MTKRDLLEGAAALVMSGAGLSEGNYTASVPSSEVQEIDRGLGIVVPSVAEEYFIDILEARGLRSTDTRDIENSLGTAVALRRMNEAARLSGGFSDIFNQASSHSSSTREARKSLSRAQENLANSNDLLTEAAAGYGVGLDEDESVAYVDGLLAHHDLMVAEIGGRSMFVRDPDAKVAQSGDYVPRPQAYAAGNILNDSEQNTSAPVGNPVPTAPRGPSI